ncbi:unnamed protein product [Adineta steineri]|uniref:Uncharacterized protein n=1 Tax=Adineta steineri TaxID=433720 RepID=A0A819JF49_9BILA|nr:unnamed protein product [Adineta steineri]CAF3928183.1 unnamed protein product [Adineta steineri]
MYYGYYDAFIIPISLLALMCLAFLLVTLAVAEDNTDQLNEKEYYAYACFVFHILLIIKLSHTSYFMIDNTLQYKLSTTKIKWNISLASIILEFFQLMAWTLIPFLWYPRSKRYLALWALEYADLISHFIVMITYTNQLEQAKWDSTLKAYFAFYIINLIVWVFPLLIVCKIIDGQGMIPPVHGMIVDIITDIPMFIITMAARAYVHNVYICIDIAVKFIVFIRGVIWVPVQVYHERPERTSYDNTVHPLQRF